MPLALRYAARSDVGQVRKGNEDSGYAGPRLLIVADGMGGHAAGELASATAVATLAEMADDELAQGEALTRLAAAVDAAGASIGEVVADNPGLAGMGTTATALYWLPDGNGAKIAIVHVGDSRAYLLRDGELSQITHDHTYVQTLVDAGRISEDEASVHPRRNLLMRALDGVQPVEPDLSIREARNGDRYLICSDGLTGTVSNTEIAEMLGTGEPTGTVIELVELALARGAPDNVTVVVAHVVEGAIEPDAEPVVVGAAGEPRVRAQLPRVHFPHDAQRDPDAPDLPPDTEGPPTSEMPTIDADLVIETPREPRLSARTRRTLIWGSVIAVTVVVLLAVIGALSALWVRSQWYVGVSGDNVAIYQGVPGSILGLPLQTTYSVSELKVDSLPTFDANLVRSGIVTDGPEGATRVVDDLFNRACLFLPRPPECAVTP
jgi:protein phosphatase